MTDDIVRHHHSFSACSELELGLRKAQDLILESDLNGALEILADLERIYITSTKLFDVMGDVLLKKGNIREGIRYKTLYEVLRGTLKISTEHGRRAAPPTQKIELKDVISDESAVDFPLTAAMGHALMQQGHYDKAYEIFMKLAANNPEDRSLIEAKDKARKKSSEKKLLQILEHWLEKIEKIRSNQAGAL